MTINATPTTAALALAILLAPFGAGQALAITHGCIPDDIIINVPTGPGKPPIFRHGDSCASAEAAPPVRAVVMPGDIKKMTVPAQN